MPTKKTNKTPTRARTPAAARKSDKAPTKTEMLSDVAEKSGLSKTDVTKVLEALETVMHESLLKHKEFTISGLMKISIARRAATKERPGRNPATGEPTIFKAKPARNVVRISPLKRLKGVASAVPLRT